MDRHYQQHNTSAYGGQEHQSYPDYQYSYPPHSEQYTGAGAGGYLEPEHNNSSNNRQQQYGYDSSDEKEMQRQHSYADSDAATRVVSFYDEKGGIGSPASSSAAVNSANINAVDYIPPAVPRRGKDGQPFTPGHVTRGSVALQAAIEGQIPKKEGLKMWRADEHTGVFTAGGKGRAAMRCCCCTLIFAVILIVGIVAAFLLWVSVAPPSCS